MADRQDTIAAIATPPGTGGIGIVRLSGPLSKSIARSLSGIEPQPRHARYCRFHDKLGRVIDSGILLYFAAPHSFTGEDIVELHGHGGRVVLNLLLKETLACGARLARPGEFTERAWLNDRIDLVQAEAIADLINSASERAARSAARSLEGEFSRAIHRIVEQLIGLRVYIEGALDFPEEELDFIAGSDVLARLHTLQQELAGLLARAEAGRKLGEGLRVVIAGRPNVGKSSLLNRLLESERAIVTEIAGTTRDTIEDTLLIEGTPVSLVDTAGLRESSDPVEREGMRRSRQACADADVVIVATDNDKMDETGFVLSELPANGAETIIVHNKIDLGNVAAGRQIHDGRVHLYLSARTGEGVELLRAELLRRAGTGESTEDLILARQRHIDALNVARMAMLSGGDEYRTSGSAELLAEQLRRAQQALGTITGEVHNDELLGEIFARFCIGK